MKITKIKDNVLFLIKTNVRNKIKSVIFSHNLFVMNKFPYWEMYNPLFEIVVDTNTNVSCYYLRNKNRNEYENYE